MTDEEIKSRTSAILQSLSVVRYPSVFNEKCGDLLLALWIECLSRGQRIMELEAEITMLRAALPVPSIPEIRTTASADDTPFVTPPPAY